MLEPPSLTILPLSIATVFTISDAGLVSTVGAVAAATGSAKPAKAEASTMRTIAIPKTFLIMFLFIVSTPSEFK